MNTLTVRHVTTYRYAQPVAFGEHRMMFRPRDSHDLRLLDTGLSITPPATMRWLHDVFGNSIAIASFAEPAAELVVESTFRAEHYPSPTAAIVLEPYATTCPFNYLMEDIPDLSRCLERHYRDPDNRVLSWARIFLGDRQTRDTMELLTAMTCAIRDSFEYARREEMGVQMPVETLARGSGSCRDFAVLMMEAARSLGVAARFVSGYLYDAESVGASPDGLVGSGSTHAWVELFLPGAGWVEFDPTNALVGGKNLIRVAVAREASQAVPLSGSYVGTPSDYLGMSVEVVVTSAPSTPPPEVAPSPPPEEAPTPLAEASPAPAEGAPTLAEPSPN